MVDEGADEVVEVVDVEVVEADVEKVVEVADVEEPDATLIVMRFYNLISGNNNENAPVDESESGTHWLYQGFEYWHNQPTLQLTSPLQFSPPHWPQFPVWDKANWAKQGAMKSEIFILRDELLKRILFWFRYSILPGTKEKTIRSWHFSRLNKFPTA